MDGIQANRKRTPAYLNCGCACRAGEAAFHNSYRRLRQFHVRGKILSETGSYNSANPRAWPTDSIYHNMHYAQH